MGSTASQIIQVKCPGLYADANLSMYIEMATQLSDSCFFGSNYQLAIALRACHDYTLDQRNAGQAGQISSIKEGDLAIAYATSKVEGDEDLSQTNYGKKLMYLIKSGPGGSSITGYGNREVSSNGYNLI